MTALLAGASAALLVIASWELFGALLRLPLLALVVRGVAPAHRAGRDGGAPSDDDARRLHAVATLTLGAAGLLIGGLAVAVLLAVLAPLLASALVRARARRWRAGAERDLVPAARALADALAAGHGPARAIEQAAGDGALTGPGRTLLAQASARLALGAAMDDVLAVTARRAGTPGWGSLTAAIGVQRRSGGDLARLLRDLADAAEQGARVEREARAASAQARLTARIVLALPLFGSALAELAAPGTTAALLSDPLARLLVAAAILCQLAALVAVRRIARVEA